MDPEHPGGDSDGLSDYSSCDGSEFEKYCSANSAFGSASWCSSATGELPNSLKTRLENRSIRDKFWRSRWNYSSADEGLESPRANRPDTLPRIRTGSNLRADTGGDCSGERVDAHGSYNGVVLSDCECSGEEGSVLEYGSDDGSGMCVRGENKQAEPEHKNENPLLINSSIAFGADDWDEFEQENGGIGLAVLTPHQDPPVRYCSDEEAVRAGDSPVRNPLCDYQFVELQKNPTTTEQCSQNGYMNIGSVRETESSSAVGSSGEQVFREPDLPRVLLGVISHVQSHSILTEASINEQVGSGVFDEVKGGPDSSFPRDEKGNSTTSDVPGQGIVPIEVKKLDTCDLYDEMVHEMEEILLDSGKSVGARFAAANQGYITQQSRQFRDGSSTASTSGNDDVYPLVHYSPKIDWVEVVGAKQKKGDVSFGERLVGVKRYTEYKLRVHSGNDQWEVERRYRDFYALYRQLKTLFAEHVLSLPSPWSDVEYESRKIFGNASPVVINERSILIQNCLDSILNYRWPFGTPNSLISFLSPIKLTHSSGLLKALVPQSLQKLGNDDKAEVSHSEEISSENISMFGKTISLVLEIKPHKSMRQLLEAQHYRCAGCHRQLDTGKTLLREIVQTLGWNKPRLCEYTGQLFCASCHTSDTAVLPARVLNLWDFSLYSVSQLAKAYLESIYDQPMLCVTAVNPFLFSKVPALLQVVSIRKEIGSMLPYVNCPFRRSIQRGLGLRRHLLESNDFFALRDLVDLSKGVFAALPIMLETISSKIFEHITQQCLECYDAGVPCAARQACEDPSSVIFPFQETETTKCGLCASIFHKPCFLKLMGCPCVKQNNATAEAVSVGTHKALSGASNVSKEDPVTGSGFLSIARPDKIWKPRDGRPVILMGSLPSNGL